MTTSHNERVLKAFLLISELTFRWALNMGVCSMTWESLTLNTTIKLVHEGPFWVQLELYLTPWHDYPLSDCCVPYTGWGLYMDSLIKISQNPVCWTLFLSHFTVRKGCSEWLRNLLKVTQWMSCEAGWNSRSVVCYIPRPQTLATLPRK